MTATTTETPPAENISSSFARVPGTAPRTSWKDSPQVSSSFMAALRAAEQMRTTTLIGKTFDVPVDMLAGRAVDDLWVTPMTLEHSEEHWPSCDMEPRHPRRHGASRWTAREYRALCRRWRREHRAWRRRPPAPPVVMVVIRIEARALTRDGTVQKFGYVQTVSKRMVVEEPAVVELIVKHMAHKLRAALVRHWEET